jgi:hypothetical protein
MNQLFAVPGFASAVDIWSVHAYAPDADSIKGLVQDRRQKLDGFGSSAPIWVDEFGQSTCIPPSGWRCVSQGDQASFLSSSFAALGDPALGVSGAIAYDFRDDGPNPLSLEQNYGVVTNLFARKQAFDAVSACLNGAC